MSVSVEADGDDMIVRLYPSVGEATEEMSNGCGVADRWAVDGQLSEVGEDDRAELWRIFDPESFFDLAQFGRGARVEVLDGPVVEAVENDLQAFVGDSMPVVGGVDVLDTVGVG